MVATSETEQLTAPSLEAQYAADVKSAKQHIRRLRGRLYERCVQRKLQQTRRRDDTGPHFQPLPVNLDTPALQAAEKSLFQVLAGCILDLSTVLPADADALHEKILRDPASERCTGYLNTLSLTSLEPALLKLAALRCLEAKEQEVNGKPRLFVLRADRATLSGLTGVADPEVAAAAAKAPPPVSEPPMPLPPNPLLNPLPGLMPNPMMGGMGPPMMPGQPNMMAMMGAAFAMQRGGMFPGGPNPGMMGMMGGLNAMGGGPHQMGNLGPNPMGGPNQMGIPRPPSSPPHHLGGGGGNGMGPMGGHNGMMGGGGGHGMMASNGMGAGGNGMQGQGGMGDMGPSGKRMKLEGGGGGGGSSGGQLKLEGGGGGADDGLGSLLTKRSVMDQVKTQKAEDILDLLSKPTAKENAKLGKFKTAGGASIREHCPHLTKDECRRANNSQFACARVHFLRQIQAHTDVSLGNCSYLDTCRTVRTCKYIHYRLDSEPDAPEHRLAVSSQRAVPKYLAALPNPQWVNCDVRRFDMKVLGKFGVIMTDPPWEIHQDLPYGTMADDEMRQLDIGCLQDDGVIFVWVTGRAMELGRECLALWGYNRVDELIWVKTNQLARLIRTGRTGHWLNHSKEHCLVGIKGNPQLNRHVDTDVVVAEVRETSRKPDEMYSLLERLSPGTRKLEIFARKHNLKPGWVGLGNQLDNICIKDPEMRARFVDKYGFEPDESKNVSVP